MLRRSSSSSNIPIFKTNLFGVKDSKASKTKRRSNSTSRLSQRDNVSSVNLLRPQRNSSLDRKSSITGLLRVTPLQRVGAKSGSLLRTTPSSAISQRTNSSRATTPSSCRKEYISIQKLATDKKWVAEQFIRVQDFIMTSNLFDLNVVNANNIKPPTINIFIYLTGVLLMEIFPRVKITKENFKEVIPAQLKVMRYPGTLANSILKTVNTMHSWPQIIGMWSWLIRKISICNGSQDLDVDNLEPELKRKVLIKQNCSDFLIKRYKIFNTNNGDNAIEEIEKANNAYVKTLADLLAVNTEKFTELKNDVVKKREYRDQQLQKIERLTAETKKLRSEIDEMVTEINRFEENDPIQESELKKELEILQSNVKEQREAIASTTINISNLREALKVQPCTYLEKRALLQQIEELNKDIALRKEKIEYAREIKSKFDHKLATEINKVQLLVTQWNRALMEISIKKPYLKKLMLREKGFHDPNFLSELEEMSNYKNTVESEVSEALSKMEKEMRKEELKQHELEEEIAELNKIVTRTNEECATISSEIEVTEMEMKKVIQDLEALKQSHDQQIKALQENNTLDNRAIVIDELKKKKEQLSMEVKAFQKKMLCFFVEMHNQVIRNIEHMDEIKGKLVEDIESRNKNIIAKQKQIIEIAKDL